ncbi:MAG TPA: BlaI/MecI/CopY family transcriptional regulator [Thermoanaerobaculia bacterium]|jgi:predicted transcriptional regulator|nr:BlaI/MecI/CopY family transcriptional regulator [Thermoanaerobaculia bacterium]
MAPRRNLTRSDWQTMEFCWALGSPTAREVYDEANRDNSAFRRLFSDWKLTTVRTFLSRLVDKGYLRTELPTEVVLEEHGPKKREVVDYVERLVGDRDRAVELVVSAVHRPSVVFASTEAKKTAEVRSRLEALGARTSAREGTARFVPTLSRAEALDESTTSFFDLIARDDPAAYDRIIAKAAERKAAIAGGTPAAPAVRRAVRRARKA